MGTFRWPLRISSMDGQQAQDVEATVDTGAAYTTLPGSLLRELGIEPMDRGVFLLADGRRVEMDIGRAWATVDGSSEVTLVVFGEDDAPALLGAYTLEGLRLAVDPMHSDSFPPISSCTRRLRRPPCAPPSCTTAISGSRDLHRPPPLSPTPHQSTPPPPSSSASARGDAAACSSM